MREALRISVVQPLSVRYDIFASSATTLARASPGHPTARSAIHRCPRLVHLPVVSELRHASDSVSRRTNSAAGASLPLVTWRRGRDVEWELR